MQARQATSPNKESHVFGSQITKDDVHQDVSTDLFRKQVSHEIPLRLLVSVKVLRDPENAQAVRSRQVATRPKIVQGLREKPTRFNCIPCHVRADISFRI